MLQTRRFQSQPSASGVYHLRNRDAAPKQGASRPSPAGRATSEDSFTLATYNVKNLFDDKDQDPELGTVEKPDHELDALARNIERSGADVFTLQEVENLSALQNFLDRYLPDQFQEVVLVEGNDRRGIDVAVISKFPVTNVVSHKDHQFPLADNSGTTSFNRDLLRVDLDIKGTPFSVYTSHFKSKRGGPRGDNERIAEAQETRRILAKEMNPYSSHNFVVTGDLNDTPDSQTLKVLTEPWQGQEPLHDTLEGLPDSQRKTFPSKKPKEQIDHILLPEHLKDNLIESGVYRDQYSRDASDHLMITARLRLSPPGQ